MHIRQLAEQTGVTIDTIRFYEKQGLLDQSHFQRGENGYRDYSERAIEQLEMIKYARTAGFTLAEIRDLVGMWKENQLTDDVIVAHLREKQRQIAAKIAELEQIHRYITDKLQRYASDTSSNAD